MHSLCTYRGLYVPSPQGSERPILNPNRAACLPARPLAPNARRSAKPPAPGPGGFVTGRVGGPGSGSGWPWTALWQRSGPTPRGETLANSRPRIVDGPCGRHLGRAPLSFGRSSWRFCACGAARVAARGYSAAVLDYGYDKPPYSMPLNPPAGVDWKLTSGP
jgi:hypothetical protein